MNHVSRAARGFMTEQLDAPSSYGPVRIMPTTIKSGLAASINSGRVHVPADAALITDGSQARLAVRWVCGGGSVNARPAGVDEVACDVCERLSLLCFDADDSLLYIGSTVKLRQRIRNHVSQTSWWGDVARIETDPFTTETAARLAEALAITRELPARNRFNIPLHLLKGGAA